MTGKINFSWSMTNHAIEAGVKSRDSIEFSSKEEKGEEVIFVLAHFLPQL